MVRSRSIATLSALSLVAALGCVSSPLFAPSDGQILLSANPAAIVLDEFADPPVITASTVVSAQVLNTNGIPQAGVTVFFTTNGGELASAPAGQEINALETDDNGFVSDTLTLQLGDPTSITVTARSGALTGTIAVEKSEVPPNQLPFPVINITPANSALLDQVVDHDGSASSDPDGDAITCFQWQIETSVNIANPDLPCIPANSRCEISQGAALSSVTRAWPVIDQFIKVYLRVTDDPSVACLSGGPVEPLAAFGLPATETYEVVCDRSAPSAGAGANQAVSLGGNAMVTVPLSGATSFDPESGIASYAWDCANGTGTVNGVSVLCDYTTAGTYQVFLTVTNGCGMTGTDTVIVTVNP